VAQSVFPNFIRKLQFGQTLLLPAPQRHLQGLDAPLPGQDGVSGVYLGETLFFEGALLAELYFLEGEHIEIGVLHQIDFFVGVPHDKGFLGLQGFPLVGSLVIIFSNIGESNEFAQLDVGGFEGVPRFCL